MARMRGGKSVRRGKMAGRKKRLLTNKFQDFLEDSLPSEEMHDRNSDIVSPVYKPSFADVYGDQSQSHKKPPRPNVFHTGSEGYVQPISRHHFHQFLAQAVTRTEETLPISATPMGFDSVEAASPKGKTVLAQAVTRTEETLPISATPMGLDSVEAASPKGKTVLAQAVTHSKERLPVPFATPMGFDSVEATSPIVDQTCQDQKALKKLSEVTASPDLKGRREDRALISSRDCPNNMKMENSVTEEIPAFHSDYACDQCNWILISPRQLQKHQQQSHSSISSLIDTNVLSSKPLTISSEAQKIRKDFSYFTPPKATNVTNPTNATPTVNETIIVSDDDEAITKLNTTIYLSDDGEETNPQRNQVSAKRKIVAKRLFTSYPLRQNQIKDGGFENKQGISYTRMNSGADSNKCFKEAIHKINKLGPGISLTRMSSGSAS